MREITTHRVEGKGGGKDTTRVAAVDEPGQGGASHHYTVWDQSIVDELEGPPFSESDGAQLLNVWFQNGPIQEVGVNGVQQEHLLAIVADRLSSFQAGPFANAYNAEALEHVNAALAALHRRTLDRIARQVEGYNKA